MKKGILRNSRRTEHSKGRFCSDPKIEAWNIPAVRKKFFSMPAFACRLCWEFLRSGCVILRVDGWRSYV